ncbi:glutamine synthetase [Ruminiclostridium hungatei]|uniref:Glutamine synthetase n=1 Tax=Ruminiclostridium hungatei TaxID=48256 RepID=A0A1V4SEC5_RUMHU|nr:glutamine synthetase III [Ruminiclostridium hungatei]OPX42174.1 glutamine synthetase [Ruminiclostridium hungatei]
MSNVPEIYGSSVFNDSTMRERLPKATYKSLKKTIELGLTLDESVAEVVASAMKDWAIEKGATHFTHWFHPMTGITAEKHDSFISPTSDGKIIMEFSGKELTKGEPDASSFPSGGLRATYEARGYTAWDCTSPAFVKDGSLYIPTAFCSYTGEVLDKKTPLLRSMEALNKQALRILKVLGNTSATRVTTTVGPEQEYFLIDRELFKKRKDLIFTGRTLFGVKPPKGQELEDHYFGNIKERVSAYMKDLDTELWKLGISAKTKHNEVAPAQHELAPIFTTSNVATDHNQLTMELMQKVALRHGLVCLLHEKPFAGVNGSGKHNNWSMSTNDGQNLLEPGNTPHENTQFLVFLAAVVKSVDDYQDLLRLSVATAGNDHRLGANEAPPAIVSIFLGDQLSDIFTQLESGKVKGKIFNNILETGVASLPKLPKDTTDRNRTSPFAFTGNKFEFRMLGSSASIAGANFVLNTIVAETLQKFADKLEASTDLNAAIATLLSETAKDHKRIIFNGNGYSEEWVAEAESRGLLNMKSTVECIPTFIKDKNVAVFVKHGVLSKSEIESRYEILLENYIKTVNIEALTMLNVAKTEILPAAFKFSKELSDTINAVKATGMSVEVAAQSSVLKELSPVLSSFASNLTALKKTLDKVSGEAVSALKQAEAFSKIVIPAMEALRTDADKLEAILPKDIYPFPTYADLLFNV